MRHRKNDEKKDWMACGMRRMNRGMKNWGGGKKAYQQWLDASTRSRRNMGDTRSWDVIRKEQHDLVMKDWEAAWDRKERWE
jgi:hypothetical protein